MRLEKGAYVGGIEAGGTKFVCAVATLDGEIHSKTTIPTRGPKKTLNDVITFFSGQPPIIAVGLGAFGPIIVEPLEKDFGVIQLSPKLKWRHFPILRYLEQELSVPVSLATDVEAAGLGEAFGGAARGLRNFAYVTIGTGIGCGLFVQGNPVRGHLHPELGHYFPQRNARDMEFPGICPYHGDCLEGLASGPAIKRRLGIDPGLLSRDHDIWEIEADYIAQLCVVISLAMSPERIVLGGGVCGNSRLVPRVRDFFTQRMAGYAHSRLSADAESFIAEPLSPNGAGLTGAISLALQSLNEQNSSSRG